MDYIVFVVEENANVRYFGRIDSVMNLAQAKRRLKRAYPMRRKFYLVKATDFHKVEQ